MKLALSIKLALEIKLFVEQNKQSKELFQHRRNNSL